MKNCIVIAPWANYSDSGFLNFENSVSEPADELEAERVAVGMSGYTIAFPDEETAAVESERTCLRFEAPEEYERALTFLEASGAQRLDVGRASPFGESGPGEGSEAAKPAETPQESDDVKKSASHKPRKGPSAPAPGSADPDPLAALLTATLGAKPPADTVSAANPEA